MSRKLLFAALGTLAGSLIVGIATGGMLAIFVAGSAHAVPGALVGALVGLLYGALSLAELLSAERRAIRRAHRLPLPAIR